MQLIKRLVLDCDIYNFHEIDALGTSKLDLVEQFLVGPTEDIRLVCWMVT